MPSSGKLVQVQGMGVKKELIYWILLMNLNYQILVVKRFWVLQTGLCLWGPQAF